MKKINYTHLGGYPFTQDDLDFMQQAKQEVLDCLCAVNGITIGASGKYILEGAVLQSGNLVSDGWLYYEGELLKLTGGTGTYIKLNTDNTTALFEDSTTKTTRTYKWAEVVNTVPIAGCLYADLERVYRKLEWKTLASVPTLFFAKDANGFVHFKGDMSGQLPAIIELPVGYKPETSIKVPVVDSAGTFAMCIIYPITDVAQPGHIGTNVGTLQDYSLDHITYIGV